MLYRLPRSAISTVVTRDGQISVILPAQRRKIRVSYIQEDKGATEVDFPSLIFQTQVYTDFEYEYPLYRLWAIKEGSGGSIHGAPFQIGNVNSDARMCWGSNVYPTDALSAVGLYFEAPFNDHWLPSGARAAALAVDIDVLELFDRVPVPGFPPETPKLTAEVLGMDCSKLIPTLQEYRNHVPVSLTNLSALFETYKTVGRRVIGCWSYFQAAHQYVQGTTTPIDKGEFNIWWTSISQEAQDLYRLRTSLESFLKTNDPVSKELQLRSKLDWLEKTGGCRCCVCVEELAAARIELENLEKVKMPVSLADLQNEAAVQASIRPPPEFNQVVQDLMKANPKKNSPFKFYQTYQPHAYRDITHTIFGGPFTGLDGKDLYTIYPGGTHALFVCPKPNDPPGYIRILTEHLSKEEQLKVLSLNKIIAPATLVDGTNGEYRIDYRGEQFLLKKNQELSRIKKEVKELPNEQRPDPVVRGEKEPDAPQVKEEAPVAEKKKRAPRKRARPVTADLP